MADEIRESSFTILSMDQEDYDSLETKDVTTLYLVTSGVDDSEPPVMNAYLGSNKITDIGVISDPQFPDSTDAYLDNKLYANIVGDKVINMYLKYNNTVYKSNPFLANEIVPTENGVQITWNDNSTTVLPYSEMSITNDNIADGTLSISKFKFQGSGTKYLADNGHWQTTGGGGSEFNSAIVADPYDETETYSVNDYVIYDNDLYKCTTSTTGEFDPESWSKTNVVDNLGSGGSGLPDVTFADNGKILIVESGDWAIDKIPSQLPSVTSTDEGKVLMVNRLGGWTAASFGNVVHIYDFSSEDLPKTQSVPLVDYDSDINYDNIAGLLGLRNSNVLLFDFYGRSYFQVESFTLTAITFIFLDSQARKSRRVIVPKGAPTPYLSNEVQVFVPSVTSSDNGKVLTVVNKEWVAQTPSGGGASFNLVDSDSWDPSTAVAGEVYLIYEV